MAPFRKVTDAELDVLEALWEEGPRTIRQLTDRLYPRGGAAHYATVQKLLDRLEAKGCVRRRQQGRANVFRATLGRRQLIAERLRETAYRLCGGSLTPLLTQLVGDADLGPADLRELRELVDRLERERKGAKP